MIVSVALQGLKKSPDIPSAVTVKRIIHDIIKKENGPSGLELNVIFVDNTRIRKINRKYLNEPGVTDVIAFPYFSAKEKSPFSTFGDIYISVPVARMNAKRYGEPSRREVVRLVIHGMLHLLGYDDGNPKSQKIMWKRQEYFVQKWSV